ncbi:MAG: hypothetical protein B7Z47_07565 [Chthoniobacter sp. 12-60-6]|nr:MAG: hypothetical protein B7Z47_07565 [Chthoniobacter sp. 12-60-6]
MNESIRVLRTRAERRPLILVVDDEWAILKLLRQALPDYGIDLEIAPHWLSALRKYEESQGQLEAALIDVQMPVCDGPEVLGLQRSQNPKLKACFMTGFSKLHSKESLQRISGWPVLEKPFVSLDFVALSLWRMIDEASSIEVSDA